MTTGMKAAAVLLAAGTLGRAMALAPPRWGVKVATPPPSVAERYSASGPQQHRWADGLPGAPSEAGRGALASLASVLLFGQALLAPFGLDLAPPVDRAASVSARVPVVHRMDAQALTEEQELVIDVWREVTRQFVDDTYNGQGEDGWKRRKLEAVRALSEVVDSKDETYKAVRTMLASLNDPYTRFLTPEQYEALTSVAKGASAGIGVQINSEPDSGRVQIVSTIPGGPAEQAGLRSGDTLVAVNGETTAGMTADLVAARCRGEPGTVLSIMIQRDSTAKPFGVDITRAAVKVKPIRSSKVDLDAGKSIALLSLEGFSQETVVQAIDALRDTKSGTDAIVIDLRGNAGGYMPAGVDMAKMFLPAQAKVISEVSRSGTAVNYFSEGIGSETKEPLFLLVDKRTASAAEIMAAALQDNKRATLVGPTRTFGKGRIQNVQQMEDGSAVAVTRAKYITPKGNDIQGVGLTPDVLTENCAPENDATTCVSGLI